VAQIARLLRTAELVEGDVEGFAELVEGTGVGDVVEVVIGRLDAATGAVDDAALKDVDTLKPVQEVRPAACKALAVGGVARVVVMLPSDATVVATVNDTDTDVASR
jgi:hypothetical protein